jgi:hypothetical protein
MKDTLGHVWFKTTYLVGSPKLHNEELRDLYYSPNIIRIIKSRRMRRAGHVAGIGEKRNACRL